MIRPLRRTSEVRSPLTAVPGAIAHDDVRVLKEIVTSLCERVELLEAQALIARTRLIGRTALD